MKDSAAQKCQGIKLHLMHLTTVMVYTNAS